MVTLYYSPGSCALAPHILLVDSGLKFETKRLDFKSANPWPEEYVKLNPNKQVPFVELESGTVVTENVAVQTLISQLAPTKQFFGDSDLEVVRSYEWLAYLSATMHAKAYSPFFRSQRFSDVESAVSGIKDRARKKIEECYQYIEGRIGERKPIERVLAVDAYLFVFFRWGNAVGFHMQREFPKYGARMVQFAELDSVKETLAQEGIDATTETSIQGAGKA